MRTWVVVAVVSVAVLVVLALPTRSQEPMRVPAMFDLTPVAKKIDELKPLIKDLHKENQELRKAVEDGNKTLELIAAGVGVMREPVRWEYKFIRSRSDKIANKLGADGWELVSVFEQKDYFLFRRPLPPERKREGAGPPP